MLSEQEFNDIFETYNKQVYRLAYTYIRSRDEALDICQDVFIVIYKKCPKDKDKLKAWIIKVTKNKCLDYLRKAKRISLLDDEIKDIPKEDIDILYYVNKLPDKYQIVIKLYYYMNYSVTDGSKVIKISEDAFKKRLQRAREMLKEMVGDDDETR